MKNEAKVTYGIACWL